MRRPRPALQVVKELLDNCQVRLKITVPPAVCQSCFKETVDTLQRDVVGNLKGFRAGKVRRAGAAGEGGGAQRSTAHNPQLAPLP